MGLENIAKTIRENTEDDENLQELLITLLNYNFTGSGNYKEDYKKFINQYASKDTEGENNED